MSRFFQKNNANFQPAVCTLLLYNNYLFQAYKEPPPRLMNPLTLFLGVAGYVQVGYEPCIDPDDDHLGVKFNLRCVIVLDTDFLFLNENELGDLFELLKEFCETRSAAVKFGLEVCADTNRNEHVILRKGWAEITLSRAVFQNFKSLAPIIINYMLEQRVLKNHFESELFAAFEKAAKSCRFDGPYIEYLAQNTCERLIIEIAVHFRSIFIKYCENQRRLPF